MPLSTTFSEFPFYTRRGHAKKEHNLKQKRTRRQHSILGEYINLKMMLDTWGRGVDWLGFSFPRIYGPDGCGVQIWRIRLPTTGIASDAGAAGCVSESERSSTSSEELRRLKMPPPKHVSAAGLASLKLQCHSPGSRVTLPCSASLRETR